LYLLYIIEFHWWKNEFYNLKKKNNNNSKFYSYNFILSFNTKLHTTYFIIQHCFMISITGKHADPCPKIQW